MARISEDPEVLAHFWAYCQAQSTLVSTYTEEIITPWLSGEGGGQGPQGSPGDPGAQGIQGLTGLTGPAGADGQDGADGLTGLQGLQGIPGTPGADGADGQDGAQGIQGVKGDTGDTGPQGDPGSGIAAIDAWPVGSVFISVVSTSPATLLGGGTWSAIGAGRVLVGLDSGDASFDTVEETGGAKTVSAAGTNAAEAAHTHSVTSNVTVADHASHTHTYTDVPNHVHPFTINAGTTDGTWASWDSSTTAGTGHNFNTANPTGGVATGTTSGPSATLSHVPTNNAVTSGAGASHNHTFTGSATSVVQPYFVVYMWKRTA